MGSTERSADCPVDDIVSKVQSYFHHLEHHRYGDAQEEGNLTPDSSSHSRVQTLEVTWPGGYNEYHQDLTS